MINPAADGLAREQAIKEREQAATKGPWEIAPRSDDAEVCEIVADYSELPGGGKVAHWIAELDAQVSMESDAGEDVRQMVANAEFIAHCRDDVPYLLSVIDALRAELRAPPSPAADDLAALRRRLAGHGLCYVCGEQQYGAAHLGCTSRYGLNADVQQLVAEFDALRAQLHAAQKSAEHTKQELRAAQIEIQTWRAGGCVHAADDGALLLRRDRLAELERAEAALAASEDARVKAERRLYAALDAWGVLNERCSTESEDATQWRRAEAKERKRAEQAEARAEQAELWWGAASVFIRRIVDAVGRPEPEFQATLNLQELALQVVGQIEEGKEALEAERAAHASTRQERDDAERQCVDAERFANTVERIYRGQLAILRAALTEALDAWEDANTHAGDYQRPRLADEARIAELRALAASEEIPAQVERCVVCRQPIMDEPPVVEHGDMHHLRCLDARYARGARLADTGPNVTPEDRA